MSPKWLLLLCLVLALFVGVVSAGEKDFIDYSKFPANETHLVFPKDNGITEPLPKIIIEPPIMKKKKVDYFDYNPSDLTEQVKKKIKDILSPNEKKNDITENIPEGKPHKTVSIDGATIAIIPTDSKFMNLEVHDVCIPFQYGTDRWYDCEVKYANR